MKISAADLAVFMSVMAHYQFDAGEIEGAKAAYRRDPDAGKMLYKSIKNNEITQLWRTEMNKEAIKKYQDAKRKLLAEAAEVPPTAIIAGGPGQPPIPIRPPPAERSDSTGPGMNDSDQSGENFE